MNKSIRKFRDAIIAFINNSSLPIEVVRLVLAEIYAKVCETAENAISQEVADEQSAQPDKLAE